ncbi:hypothetical protein GH714_017285 [Hevea brasiliensis]|uniref:NB-ARC domain-containing protein n=1 Tax=Hevea brasiliensis TaxID=3981 RepID=A0A6A6NC53_HEVBR|nr:hypothetical protein GH714_017285 [Hevea brasiliensis]
MMEELESIGHEFYGKGKIGFPSLMKLKLEDTRSLKKWKEIHHGDFAVHKQLEVLNCRSITNLPKFPSLSDLLLENCHQTILSSDIPSGLQNLYSLKELHISKCPTLVSFTVEKLGSSLKNLRILSCANLESLPMRLHELQNLESLSIHGCPKLVCLPASRLPASPCSLSIMECALLEERCAEGGEDWPKMEHIPEKHITRVELCPRFELKLQVCAAVSLG